jgi:hypothetical protein
MIGSSSSSRVEEGDRGTRRREGEDREQAGDETSSTISYSNQPPSFIGSNVQDISHTQPFNLYEHAEHRQRSPMKRSGRGGGEVVGQDQEEEELGEIENDVDDILFGGKTLTFREERQSMLPRNVGGIDLGGIVDDAEEEDERHQEINRMVESTDDGDELSYVDNDDGQEQGQPAIGEVYGYPEADEDESFNIERGLHGGAGAAGVGGGGFGNRLLDGPEDTLFGMPQTQAQSQQQHQSSRAAYQEFAEGEEEDDTFTENQEIRHRQPIGGRGGAGAGGFRLHGLSDMETLHGGELLSSGKLPAVQYLFPFSSSRKRYRMQDN